MTFPLVAAFLAGLGFGLLAGGLAVRHSTPARRRWRDLPPFITKD